MFENTKDIIRSRTLKKDKQFNVSCKSTIFIYITAVSYMVWLGLWCLTPLSTVFQLYRGGLLLISTYNVWKYQRYNQKPNIEEGQTIQCRKQKGQNDKQWYTKVNEVRCSIIIPIITTWSKIIMILKLSQSS
jgi:hypothetical protein